MSLMCSRVRVKWERATKVRAASLKPARLRDRRPYAVVRERHEWGAWFIKTTSKIKMVGMLYPFI